MSAKEIVLKFYKSEALIDSEIMKEFVHPDILIDWNSSGGFIQMNYDSLLKFTDELNKAYIRSKVRMSHIVVEKDLVSVRFSHFVKTFENPREEMLMSHCMVIWQIKDNKLFRGYQMTQLF